MMTTQLTEYKKWMQLNQFNHAQAAKALGISQMTSKRYASAKAYEAGKPTPKPSLTTRLAMHAIVKGLTPWAE